MFLLLCQLGEHLQRVLRNQGHMKYQWTYMTRIFMVPNIQYS
jgi:hypothetical protein